MTDRRGVSRPGNSYQDPAYDSVERGLEKKHNLPAGLLRSIRTQGERSNADQVSEAGARSVYQIIPATRDAFLKQSGIDAFASPEAAAEVAALHLRESFNRTGNWGTAVAEYHGGTSRKNWGGKTRAYVDRVNGRGRAGGASPTPVPTAPLPDPNTLDLLNTGVGDFHAPEVPEVRQTKTEKRLAELTAVVPGGILQKQDVPNTPVIAAEVQQEQADRAAETARFNAAHPYGANAPLRNFGAMVGHAIDEEWFIPQVARAIDRGNPEATPGYFQWYDANRDDVEAFAETPGERQQLRDATSRADLDWVRKDIARQRANRKALDATGHTMAFSLLAGLTDPVGWLAGAGVGKAFEVANIGSRALLASGSKLAATASLGAEGAVGNLAFTGLLDAAGRTTTSEDYAMSAAAGLGIGLALSPILLRARPDTATPAIAERISRDAQTAQAARLLEARANLGEGASPDAVATEAARLDTAEQSRFFTSLLADIPENERLLHHDPEKLLTTNPALKAEMSSRYNLDTAVSDGAERELLAEHLARAEAIVAANPTDAKGMQTVLASAGMESTGLRLLNSDSPVAKAVALTLLESTTGAGGRRRTAAMSMHVRQRMYNRTFYAFDDLYHGFRRSEGQGIASEFVSGTARKRFNQRVFDEVEARMDAPEGQTFDVSPHVVEAANLWERGMNQMRVEMQHVGVVGSARLGATSRGYMTHKLDARAVLLLNPTQRAKVRDVLAGQFVDPANGFDDVFAKRLATKYLERAEDAAKGGYDVPVNAHSPETASMVEDALRGMGIEGAELSTIMGKFSRGGAGFTKQRLRLDLQADIGDGLKLRDLYNTDISGLYRGYARRVAGEVALAQHGIMGQNGLAVLRRAIIASRGSVEDLKAYDQIAAEFLNQPFGSHNHKWMDNVRTATSVARLGGMGFTQLAEYGNAIAALGIHRTFAAIGALPRMVREVSHLSKGGQAANPILQSIDTLGGHLGLDDYQLTRWWDVKDNDVQVYSADNIGIGTRTLRAAAHMQATMTGQRMITAVQTRGMAEQIVRKAVQFIRDGHESKALADMGITPELAAAFRGDLSNIATFRGGKLAELNLTKSRLSGHELMTFRDAIERGAGQIIQRTYIGETGKWAHDGLLKMLFQFRTFGVTAVEKQWGRGVRNYGAVKSAMYLLGAMGFAVPIHVARVQMRMTGMSRKEREEFADRNLSVPALARATMNYASASGLLGDVLDIGTGFASSYGGDAGKDVAELVGVRGTKGQGKLVGGAVAPGMGLVEDVWSGVHGDGKKIVKMLPGANLPYTQPIINSFYNEE